MLDLSNLELLEAPSDPVISLDEAKAHMRIDDGDNDDVIEDYVAAASAMLDGPKGFLGRALVTQKWRLTFEPFRHSSPWRAAGIVLPLAPFVSVEAFSLIRLDGTTIAVAEDAYRIVGTDPAQLRPGTLGWPWQAEAADVSVVIDFTAGYGAADGLPEPIRQAARMWVAHLFENREATAIGAREAAVEIPLGVADHLANYREFAF